MIKSAIFAGKCYSAATYEQVARKIAADHIPLDVWTKALQDWSNNCPCMCEACDKMRETLIEATFGEV